MHKTLLALMALILTPISAQAQSIYTHDNCGFQVNLPAEPAIKTICENDDKSSCYDIAKFTQIYSLDTSLQVDVICNPISPDMEKHYQMDIMKSTLKSMMDKGVIKTYETYGQEGDNFRQATLIGEGLQGKTETLFIAQLWINKTSAFSIQGAIVGNTSSDADKTLSSILASIDQKQSNVESSDN